MGVSSERTFKKKMCQENVTTILPIEEDATDRGQRREIAPPPMPCLIEVPCYLRIRIVVPGKWKTYKISYKKKLK